MAVLLGRTTASTTADFASSDTTAAWDFTAVASGTLTVIFAQSKVANTGSSYKLGIYADSGSAPAARLGVGTVTIGTPTGTGVFGAIISPGVAIVSGTKYWLAIRSAGDAYNFQGDSGGNYFETNPTSQDFPNPYGVTAGPSVVNAIIWGEDSPQSGPGRRVFPFALKRFRRPGNVFLPFPLPDAGSVVAPTVFPQALTANATATATIAVNVAKRVTATATATATIQKTVAKALTATATATSSIQKTVLKLLSSSATATATIATLRSVTLTLTATATATATMTRTVLKTVSASATSTATMTRTVAKALTASATATATMTRTVLKLLTATATSTASLLAQKVKLVALTANATATATMSRVVLKTVSASATSTATIQKVVLKTLSATASATATLVATFVAGGGAVARLFRTLMGVGQ